MCNITCDFCQEVEEKNKHNALLKSASLLSTGVARLVFCGFFLLPKINLADRKNKKNYREERNVQTITTAKDLLQFTVISQKKSLFSPVELEQIVSMTRERLKSVAFFRVPDSGISS